ncbi:hypothetical protein UA08_08539 [Talaromyces atroroseus]|uniref:Probable beta-glucosidase I n=1 Tax=Talaromyces atroroseus TaxID=1441469 RepID=A0A1Q5Q7Q0_TALAT|nr:hypothetical protein UA08_08539 [Talaromyces atroroseus]OKL56237.1 hypothetical protein UA08_08539 [Talaromyces atroroseus]
MADFNVEQVLEQLTLDVKISLLSGKDFWHTQPIPRLSIPSLRMCDGPNGIRGVRHFDPVPASCLPCGTALGALWDPELLEIGGQLMGEEARAKGIHILLGPTVNIQRSPLGGRGFESYSEDPVLSGTLAAAHIHGMQSKGVATTIKHFVCNDQEHERKAVNVIVSDRALREIYLMPFQVALQQCDPWGLMTSYNKVNGTHVNLEMPGPSTWRGFALKQASRSNKVAPWDIDARARNMLKLLKRALESGIPEDGPDCVGDVEAAKPVLRQLASSSIVLLKNEGNLLPYKRDRRAPSGKSGYLMRFYAEPPSCTKLRQPISEVETTDTMVYLTDYRHKGIKGYLYYTELEAYFEPEYTGEYTFGLTVYGTGKLYIDGKLLTAGTKHKILVDFGTAPTQTTSTLGSTNMGAGGFRLGCIRNVDPEEEIAAAVEIARAADNVIICAGLNEDWESEGFDRVVPSLSDELIRRVAAANPNTTVVIQSGTPVTMPWLEQVPAIVQAWYGGNEAGNAIAEVLFGDVNPSGKLPLSFPLVKEDNPAFLNSRSEACRMWYGEDIYVGYRFYEKTRRALAFPFGHGLSFSDFSIKDLCLSESEDTEEDVALTVTACVENRSAVDGHEVVQVDIRQLNPSLGRPVKKLEGFKKVFVRANSTQEVKISISKKRATSFWDERRDSWVSQKDTYEVLVGSSSDKIAQTAEFEVSKTQYWRGL